LTMAQLSDISEKMSNCFAGCKTSGCQRQPECFAPAGSARAIRRQVSNYTTGAVCQLGASEAPYWTGWDQLCQTITGTSTQLVTQPSLGCCASAPCMDTITGDSSCTVSATCFGHGHKPCLATTATASLCAVIRPCFTQCSSVSLASQSSWVRSCTVS